MLQHLLARLSLRRKAWLAILALMLTACSIGSWHAYREAQAQAASTSRTHFTAAEIRQRALKFCLTFSNSARLVAEPQYGVEHFSDGQGQHKRRFIWTVLCKADDKDYFLDFNDATGNILGLRPQYVAVDTTTPQIHTPEEAANVALLSLQEMGLVSGSARVKLQRAPQHQDIQHSWKTIWSVTGPAANAPAQVLLIVSDADGKPTRMVNNEEARGYTHAL
ncbi:MAG TPA: hypothetical protein VKU00_23615 [Chthonomonadaceae bacterium]|nr:hypothetical protein [Chthonomonadaceae bacterium]